MVSEDLFDNLDCKRVNLHQCKSKILGGLQSKIYSVSPVQICDRSCGTLTFPFLCAIQIMFAMLRYCSQLKLSGSIYQPEFLVSATHVCSNCAHSYIKFFHKGRVVLNSVKFVTRSMVKIECHLKRTQVAGNDLFTAI